jgi:hypothetical protein
MKGRFKWDQHASYWLACHFGRFPSILPLNEFDSRAVKSVQAAIYLAIENAGPGDSPVSELAYTTVFIVEQLAFLQHNSRHIASHAEKLRTWVDKWSGRTTSALLLHTMRRLKSLVGSHPWTMEDFVLEFIEESGDRGL